MKQRTVTVWVTPKPRPAVERGDLISIGSDPTFYKLRADKTYKGYTVWQLVECAAPRPAKA